MDISPQMKPDDTPDNFWPQVRSVHMLPDSDGNKCLPSAGRDRDPSTLAVDEISSATAEQYIAQKGGKTPLA